MTGIPSEIPAEVLASNARVADQTGNVPPVREVGAAAGRQAREQGKSLLGPPRLSPRESVRAIDGPGGLIRLRIIHLEGRAARRIFLHIHGGGWVWGGPHHHDPQMTALADAIGLITASTSYRLAPEHPYPAGPDDCKAAALWLSRNGVDAFSQELIVIGGESAAGRAPHRRHVPPAAGPPRSGPVPGSAAHLRGLRPARYSVDASLRQPAPDSEHVVHRLVRGTLCRWPEPRGPRQPHHRQAQLALAITLIITIKLIDWRNRWNPNN